MRYSYTALALALATQAIAQPNRHAARQHGHAAFHAKKDAALPEVEKRQDIDWSKALADVNWGEALAGVDWSTVNYGATSTTAAAAASSTTSIVSVATPVAPAKVPAKASSVAYTTAAATPTTLATSASSTTASAAAATSSTTSSVTSTAESLVSDVLDAVQEAKLLLLGVVSAGLNAVSDSESVWIGTDGPYTMEISNSASEELFLVAWGPSGSWINANVPLVTLALPAGSSKTLSFSDGASGALSAFYSDTELVDGQLSNTWVEFTMGEEGVFDISKEVNMNGHTVEVVGPSCTSNMTTCVFQCTADVDSCEYDYELVNCANGSQDGATFGTYGGADSGGCGGLGSSAAMTATFS